MGLEADEAAVDKEGVSWRWAGNDGTKLGRVGVAVLWGEDEKLDGDADDGS